MSELLSLAEMREITGQPARSLQLWTDASILIAEPDTDRQGRGVHRRYKRVEGVIAIIASEVSSMRMTAANMREFTDIYRSLLIDDVVFATDPIATLARCGGAHNQSALSFSYIVNQAMMLGRDAYDIVVMGSAPSEWELYTVIEDKSYRDELSAAFGGKEWLPCMGEAFKRSQNFSVGITLLLSRLLHDKRHFLRR